MAIFIRWGVLEIVDDFDGDNVDETVTFRFQQTQHWVTFAKGHVGYEISPCEDFLNTLESARAIHLAVKDVTSDGIPELLIAADRGDAWAQLSIWGMSDGRFSEIAVLDGQFRIYVYENGHIVMPCGSVGLYFNYRWNPNTRTFGKEDIHDPLRTRSAF